MLITIIKIVFLINSINACFYSNTTFIDRSQFLSNFPDNHKVNNVSLIATIGSGTYTKYTKHYKIQLLNIKQQLKHGVRVLDLGLGAISNRFALYTGPIYLGLLFEDVLSDIENFLDKNPREFVILLIKEDYSIAKDVTMSNCQIIKNYVKHSKKLGRIVTDWNLKSTFKKLRGKILLATQFKGSGFDGCVVNLHEKCLIQNKECKKTKSEDEIDSKWESIFRFQLLTFYKKRQCFINNLYYFGSKHSANVIANYGYFSSNGECIEPINRRMVNYFINPHRGLIIIVATFVTQELIDKINFSNVKRSNKNDINNVIRVIGF